VGSRGYDGGGTLDQTFRGAGRPSFLALGRARRTCSSTATAKIEEGFGVWREARVRGNSVARGKLILRNLFPVVQWLFDKKVPVV
jgi:hypothetical protein